MNEPELKPYTKEELIAGIEESLADIAAGRVYTLEEFNKKLEEDLPWLKRKRKKKHYRKNLN